MAKKRPGDGKRGRKSRVTATRVGGGAFLVWAIWALRKWTAKADFAAWDQLVRDALRAFLTGQGPLPLLLFALLVGMMIYTGIWMIVIVRSKNDEINRICGEKRWLQEKLLGESPPTTRS